MILTVPLQSGTSLANVRYKWIAGGVEGAELSTGVTQPDATLPVFRFDILPPDDAEELIAYDATDPTSNWNVAQFKIAEVSSILIPSPGVPGTGVSWGTPTADDVLSEFTPTETASINSLMGGSPLNVTTKLSLIVGRTIAEIRGYILSGDYALDPDPSRIPLSLFNDCIAIARWRFLISVPALKQLQTDDRKGAYTDAIEKLRLIAQAKFSVEPPGEVSPNVSGMWNSENKLIMRTHPVPKPANQFTPQTDTYANPDAPEDFEATL